MKNICISFNRSPSPWIRRWYFILTFCRCSVIIFICIYVLLRFLSKIRNGVIYLGFTFTSVNSKDESGFS
jgi:hypothetical protein